MSDCNSCGRDYDKQLRRGLCHMCYERRRRAGHIDPLVSARPAQQYMDLLVNVGWRYREIARAANINPGLLCRIKRDRDKQINAKTASAICAISIGDLQRCRRSGRCTNPQARAAKVWVTRRANKIEAQRIAEREALRLSRAGQHTRQQHIMAARRRDAERHRQLANPHGLPLGIPTGSWVDEALCAQTDPDLFFPEKGGSSSTRSAKRVCLGCPVRQQCLDWAMRPGREERYGIWGGKSERERRRMERNIA